MDSNYKEYDHTASFARIDAILAQPQSNFEVVDSLPDRDRLTFENGFYAKCSAFFIDLRESSALPSHYNRPALARLYRAYISELVAILNGSKLTREVNIVGDGVWAVFNTPKKADINEVFSLACKANSLMKVLNYKLKKAKYKTPIRAGIGLAWGKALMIKAGHKGSTINDVVYMGDVVNRAAKLAAMGSKGPLDPPMCIDSDFRFNLNDHNKGLTKKHAEDDFYTSRAINTAMQAWYEANCS